ncbi:hypothetical protein A1O7_01525 [Cladophialophora yegresii CBS 114405]|uniref:Uncharacterized protein n=1 Tax=Cladophialophora yegresii CBS 114405 TaxID=1182544 RepID=W9WJM8_9EURO|nr:uncharacterized protein A1O7_01525 [Cladophialophora yegresii CBS 114405]EXJ65185.1 hypothetical protein A1O7_01525 [Cladophialophora yegresii CBS 114405]
MAKSSGAATSSSAPPTVFINFTATEYVPVTATTTASEFFTDTTTTSEFYTDTTTTSEFFTDTTTTSEFFTDTTTTSQFFTNTTTLPITIYQTIISTSIVTTTQTVTETTTTISITPTTLTTPTTATVTTPTTETVTTPTTETITTPTTATLTETSISTTPTTATATEIISIYEITTQATSITLCPTRIVNPTYTAAGPYPTDWTWGCPPGWLCKPVLENCNFEAGIPDPNFLCSPNQCIPASVLPPSLPTWDLDIYGNSTPATNPALRINVIDDFFNMDPTQFGLTYDIFVVNEVLTRTTTILLPPSPTVAARQAQTKVPGACYPWCNNCLLEAQSNGKTSKLCVPGSAFEVSLAQCEQCIDYHKADDSASFVQIAPQFQQFLDYCEQFSTVGVSTTLTTPTTNAAGSTLATATGTIMTTVTPKSSAPPPSSAPSSPVVTIATLTPVPSPTTATSEGSTMTATVSTLSTLPTSSPSSTPPAPISSATQPYTTTETVVTTSYSHRTVSGSAWGQVTIIMPVGVNSTTTVYGSDLTSGGATLVLPTSPTTSTYTTTLTVTPSGEVSALATTTGASGGSAAASGTSTAPQSTFTGAASALKFSAGTYQFQSTAAALTIVSLLATFLL